MYRFIRTFFRFSHLPRHYVVIVKDYTSSLVSREVFDDDTGGIVKRNWKHFKSTAAILTNEKQNCDKNCACF
jgi:hypothetical protein